MILWALIIEKDQSVSLPPTHIPLCFPVSFFLDPLFCFSSLISLHVSQIGEGNGTPLQYSCLEKSHGWRSLVGCSPWGHSELNTTERLHFYFSLSCLGEGNGNPLQWSCLENPRDRSLVGCRLWNHTESDTTEATWQQQQQCLKRVISTYGKHIAILE